VRDGQIIRAGAQALDAAGRAESAANRAELSGGGGGVEIATDEEIAEMLEEVFGEPEAESGEVATDGEIDEMLNEVFGNLAKQD